MNPNLTPGYQRITVPATTPPTLLVVVDTEEEFDWNAPFDRRNDGVSAMAECGRFQTVCDEFGIRPTWVVDHPVAAQPEGRRLLRRFLDEGRCTIGAHLHPWVSPPFSEEVCARNSYPGNLPAALEAEKLESLFDVIEDGFGERPRVYKAGRYGLGPATAQSLLELGIEVDLSLAPPFDLSGDGGPDYSEYDDAPFRFGPDGALLGLPTTGAFVGRAGSARRGLYRFATRPLPMRLHAPGVLARLGLVERLRLTPEGHGLRDLIRLTRALHARGTRVFSFSLHSPSMLPGCTPYVGNDDELDAFLERCRRYFRFFLDEWNGVASTPLEVARHLAALPPRRVQG